MLNFTKYPYITDLSAKIYPIIQLQKETVLSSYDSSKRGGAWSGPTNLQDIPALIHFFNHIRSDIPLDFNLRYEAWGNILIPGSHISRHNHIDSGARWTGVLYITPAILIIGEHVYPFQPGDVALFSSDEMHEIPICNHYRVSIAFNIFML